MKKGKLLSYQEFSKFPQGTKFVVKEVSDFWFGDKKETICIYTFNAEHQITCLQAENSEDYYAVGDNEKFYRLHATSFDQKYFPIYEVYEYVS